MQIRHHVIFEPADLARMAKGRLLSLVLNGTPIDVSVLLPEPAQLVQTLAACPHCERTFPPGRAIGAHIRFGHPRKPLRLTAGKNGHRKPKKGA